MSTYDLSFFGHPRLRVGGVDETLAAKHWGLLLYLVTNEGVVARSVVAEMLWGAEDRVAAQGSLRMALSRLPEVVKRGIRAVRGEVEWVAGEEAEIDLERLRRALVGSDVDEVLRVYRGDLLQEFPVDKAPEFGDWLVQQRNVWRQRVYEFLETVAESRLAQQDVAGALACARAWLARDDGCETAHRLMIKALLVQGQRDAAMRQYEACVSALAVQAGRAPSAATSGLMKSAAGEVRHEPPVGKAGRLKLWNAVVPATAMLGREGLLLKLGRLIDETGCRLLTLHGMGGIGKTRLAHALGSSVAGRYQRLAAFISCERATETGTGVLDLVAGVLELQVKSEQETYQGIVNALGTAPALVVLDNVESLLQDQEGQGDGPPEVSRQIARLLAEVPGLKIVVTSRQPLRLMEEWVVTVEGLAYPPEGEGVEHCRRYAAVKLYEARARQLKPEYSVDHEVADVARLVRLVEGLPLAIELAAAWVDQIRPARIVEEWQGAIAELRSRAVNRPGRHATIEAAIDWSWQQLGADEKRALEVLALLPGGASRETALAVAEADGGRLQRLVERSLLRREGERYSLHPVVSAYALRRNGRAKEDLSCICRHFAREVSARAAALLRGGDAGVERWFDDERHNVAMCWQVSLAGNDLETLKGLAGGYFRHCLDRGELQVGLTATRAYRERMAACTPPETREICLAIGFEGPFLDLMGLLGEARDCYRKLFLDLTDDMFPREQIGVYHCNYGYILLDYGDLEAAIARAQSAMQYFEEDSGLAFRPHLLLGSAYMATARWQEALRHIQRASEIVKASGRSARSCMVSVFYAGTLLELGHVDEAVALLYETEALCKEDGFLVARADCLLYLGAAFAIRQDWVQARVMAIRAGDLAHEASYPALQSEAEALLADCAMADRLIQEALVHAQRSGELARATGRDRTLTLSLHRLGRALIAGGDRNGGIAAYVEGLSVGPVALLESKLPSAVDALLFLRQRPGYEAQAARLLAGVAAGSEASYAVREHMRRAGVEPLAGSKIPSGQAVVRETLALLQAIN